LDSFATYLDCGKTIVRVDNSAACDFQVFRILDITDKIIPFLDK